MTQQKKILVTGGAGFIGSFLCPRLLEKNYQVTALDIDEKSAEKLRKSGINVKICDLTDSRSLKGALDGFDVIIHLAARLNPWGTRKMFYDSIFSTTKNLLENIGNNVPQFIYLSSICAAGAGGRTDHLTGLKENDQIYKTGRSYYCDAKYDSEKLVMDYHNRGIIHATIVRPSNVIGPGSVWVSDFSNALIRKRVFPLIDNGKHHAALVYVENLVDGIMLTLMNDVAYGNIYHFCDDYNVDWQTYIYDLSKIIGKKVKFSSIPFPLAWVVATLMDVFIKPFGIKIDTTRHTVGLTGRANDVSTSKAQQELGWVTRISYQEAMARIANWLKSSFQAA